MNTKQRGILSAMAKPGTKRTSILMIDDDLFFRNIFKETLKKLGITKVTAVGSARAAVELLQQGSVEFHVIFLDLDMPDMNGIAFLQTIRDSHNQKVAELPVIIVSGHNNEVVRKGLSQFGILGFLGKPPELAELEGMIDTLENRLG